MNWFFGKAFYSSGVTGEDRGEGEAQGFALVTALAFLLVITLLGVSLFLGVNLEQKAAGNSLQKTRAMEVAKSATLAAERWIARSSPAKLSAVTCANAEGAGVADFRVCSLAPTNPPQPGQWSGGATQVGLKNLEASTSGAHDKYYAKPGVWISFLGHTPSGTGNLYRINTYAYGGNQKSLVVTETVFYVGKSMRGGAAPARNLGH